MKEQTEILRARLRYQSLHRGTKEMDVLMSSFVARYLVGFSREQLEAYDRILKTPDQDLYDWYVGASLPPVTAMTEVLRLFLDHRPTS